jgi:hypothetical protein
MVFYKRGKIWWLAYFHNGKRISKSTKTTTVPERDGWVKNYFGAIGKQGDSTPDADCTFAQALNRYVGPPTGKPVAPHVNSIQTSFDLNPGAVAIARI